MSIGRARDIYKEYMDLTNYIESIYSEVGEKCSEEESRWIVRVKFLERIRRYNFKDENKAKDFCSKLAGDFSLKLERDISAELWRCETKKRETFVRGYNLF